jgi:predicted patatin/cPLA2 family phospholipase
MEISKKQIHFILPGGGVNGAFQAGFLYRFLKDYYDKIIISRIDGISVGALNGLAIILEDIEFIKSIWYYIEHRDTVFNSHGTNSEMWYKGSIYDSSGLRNLIYMHKEFIKKEEIEKYNCVVHNCNTQTYEYINGTRPNLLEYIIASASPPLLSPYLKIDETFYSDGCIDQIYPIDYVMKNELDDMPIDNCIHTENNEENNKNVENSSNKINVVVGYYESNNYYLFNIYKTFKKNIYNNNADIQKLIDNNKIITVNNPCFYNLIDFSRENIDNGFKLGEEAAIEFYNKHILKLE